MSRVPQARVAKPWAWLVLLLVAVQDRRVRIQTG